MSYRFLDVVRRFLAYGMFGGGILIVLFWTLYYADIITLNDENRSLVDRFESAFLLADFILGILLFLAGVGLLKKKPFGTFALVAASSMVVYLGILDVTFYTRQGLYFPITSSTMFELMINCVCIAGGILTLWFGWRLWRIS
jgi:hypothetical protein